MGKYGLILVAAFIFAQGAVDPFPGVYIGKDLRPKLCSAGSATKACRALVASSPAGIRCKAIGASVTSTVACSFTSSTMMAKDPRNWYMDGEKVFAVDTE